MRAQGSVQWYSRRRGFRSSYFRRADYVNRASDGRISFSNVSFRLRTYVYGTRAVITSAGPPLRSTYMDWIFHHLTSWDLFCLWIMSYTWRKIRTVLVSSVQWAFLARRFQYRTCAAERSAKHLNAEVVGSEGTERSNCAERVASERV